MRGAHRARQVGAALRNRLAPGAVVLLYHRVTQLHSDPFQVAVTPAHFAEHLKVIRRLATPVRLGELTGSAGPRERLRSKVALTFDDGYADNLLEAKPLLEEADVPATVFVSSGFMGGEREFWWDELERLSALGGDSAMALRARLLRLAPPVRDAELERLRAVTPFAARVRPSHRQLTAEETARLAEDGLVEVGSHTVTHANLATLPEPEQYREMLESREHLEQVVGRPVSSFSYPFGGRQDFGRTTATMVAQCGYEVACVNWPGTVWTRTDRFLVPRLPVRDWDGEEFAARLGAWLEGRHIVDSG